MSEELKPCPFCGANDINVGESALPDTTREDGAKKFEVSCECLCAGPARRTREEAISDWNRRPSPPPAVGEVGEALRRGLESLEWTGFDNEEQRDRAVLAREVRRLAAEREGDKAALAEALDLLRRCNRNVFKGDAGWCVCTIRDRNEDISVHSDVCRRARTALASLDAGGGT